MTNFKRLPILIIILLVAGVFFAGSVKREIDPPGKYEKILAQCYRYAEGSAL